MKLGEHLARLNAGLPPPCVVVAASGRPTSLSIYLPNGETWIVPWTRFSRARFSDEELTLEFADDEIVVRGQNLAEMLKDVAGLRVESLRMIEPNYRALLDSRAPCISELEFRAVPP